MKNAYLISENFILLQNLVQVVLKGFELGFPLLTEPLGAYAILDKSMINMVKVQVQDTKTINRVMTKQPLILAVHIRA